MICQANFGGRKSWSSKYALLLFVSTELVFKLWTSNLCDHFLLEQTYKVLSIVSSCKVLHAQFMREEVKQF